MDLNLIPTDFDKKINDNQFKQKVISLTNEILKERFAIILEKQEAFPREERYNFACPYCGDSARESRKKRANIYYNGYNFHCYNCNIHTTIDKFLNDFGKSLDPSETIHAINMHSNAVSNFTANAKNLDVSYFISPDILEKYAVPRDAIFKKYQLTEIDESSNKWIRKYLKERHQTNHTVFGWNTKLMRLFIFNYTQQGKVLGFQVRNFKSSPKYVTHTLKMIYMNFNIAIPTADDFNEVTRISFLFGIATTDFSQMITITEGPLDAFLIHNGMSTCGINNDFPFEISNVRWMYDYDKDGISAALKKISNKELVFLWTKYIGDVGLNIYKKKIDYTDIVTIAKKTRRTLLPIDSYFSNSKYDSYYI